MERALSLFGFVVPIEWWEDSCNVNSLLSHSWVAVIYFVWLKWSDELVDHPS
jgi:hypothetical protein